MELSELLSTRGYRIVSAQDAAAAEIEIRRAPGPDLARRNHAARPATNSAAN